MDLIRAVNLSDHHIDETTITSTITTILTIISRTIFPATTWAAATICTEVAVDQCHHEVEAIRATRLTTVSQEVQEDPDQMVAEAIEKISQKT